MQIKREIYLGLWKTDVTTNIWYDNDETYMKELLVDVNYFRKKAPS